MEAASRLLRRCAGAGGAFAPFRRQLPQRISLPYLALPVSVQRRCVYANPADFAEDGEPGGEGHLDAITWLNDGVEAEKRKWLLSRRKFHMKGWMARKKRYDRWQNKLASNKINSLLLNVPEVKPKIPRMKGMQEAYMHGFRNKL